MGVRSDVGIALKTEHCERLVELTKEHSPFIYRAPEGNLFVWHDIKWYTDSPGYIAHTVTDFLKGIPEEDYLVVEACAEYPESEGADDGSWDENPWGLQKITTCVLEYDNGRE